jgi:putative membrane-bound dehydrogenase-like protein
MNRHLPALLILTLLFSCNKSHQKLTDEQYQELSEEEKRSVEYALEGITLEDSDLELQLFASEPMLRNPTNMDIDARGRVWITEGYNYRNGLNPKNPYEKKGDRILILEDTDGDGKADKSTVFYQGEDINSALGIGVFGNKVVVSCSPNVFVFTDEDGDDVPDKKEILFSGIGGEQHDHGMHAVTFGPDGKFYFNFGNSGEGIRDKNGKQLKDSEGRFIDNSRNPYQEGMIFRSDQDGGNLEVMAWNFRNNYEVTVDSYGRMWQSDNDDDGNRGVRINYVMDYGNYGFKDEFTGADWRARRVNMEDSIPLRHWHQNDPGVVPNLLPTFAGSPTGITIYEGDLLPEKYKNQILHTDAGPNVLRSYPVEKSGAGFTAKINVILDGNKRDNWFRPSDVTVAPDGSIFVSDWYDPGVGGHAIGDTDRGRIYRVTSKKHSGYMVPQYDFESIEGNVKELQSPNIARRYIAWNNLHKYGTEAEAALESLYEHGESRQRARALWLLSKLPKGKDYIIAAFDDDDENIRITAIRAARELKKVNFNDFYTRLASDKSPQVRREIAFAIRYRNLPQVWQKLAKSYTPGDRWYLEALGIAATENWDALLPDYMEEAGDKWIKNDAVLDIIWRSRSSMTMDLLGQIIPQVPLDQRWRYYRAMDFQKKGDRNSVLFRILADSDEEEEKLVILKQLDISNLETYPKLREELKKSIANAEDADFLDLIKKYRLPDYKDRLLGIIFSEDRRNRNISEAAALFVDLYGIKEVTVLCNQKDEEKALQAIGRFGLVDTTPVTNLLISIFSDSKRSQPIREKAMEAMSGWNSEEILWGLVLKGKVPESLMPIARKIVLRTWHIEIRGAATEFFKDSGEPDLDVDILIKKSGNSTEGKNVFDLYCKACHLVKKEGVDFGPGLTQIGSKLSKQGLYNAILNPSEGIGFGYETQEIRFKDGTSIQAIITSKTENEVYVKLPGMAEQTRYSLSQIKEIKQLETSLMPKFPLTEDEIVDLVSYLEDLK